MDHATWLAELDHGLLEDLLSRRPDVMHGGPPHDLTDLATRLSYPGGIGSALLDQTLPAVQVLTAVMTFGTSTPSRIASILQTAPTADGRDHLTQVEEVIAGLSAYGLVWGYAEEVASSPRLRQSLEVGTEVGLPAAVVMETIPAAALRPVLRAWGLPAETTKHATLAALSEMFADPARVEARLEQLSPRHRRVLAADLRGEEDPTMRWDPRRIQLQAEATEAALELGLLLPGYDWMSAHVPAETAVALLELRLPFDPSPPAVMPQRVSAQMVERESQAALTAFSDAALAIVDRVRSHPIALLKSGGVWAREVTKLAKATGLELPMVRLVVEILTAAAVLELDSRGLVCGETASAWRDSEGGARVVLLIDHWVSLGSHPTQTHDEAGAIGLALPWRSCILRIEGRRVVLSHLIAQEVGAGLGEMQLGERVRWTAPFVHLRHRRRPVEDPYADVAYGYRRGRRSASKWEEDDSLPVQLDLEPLDPACGEVLTEARMLGLVAHGSATPLLRALAAGERADAVSLADGLLPTAAGSATFGSDLTVLVSGPPTGELTALLDSCADRESRGGGVTWRISAGSVRRALDDGESADGLRERLAAVASSGLPQPLDYLLTDVGRRHGELRVGDARSVVTGLDQALLAQAVADRKLARLGLRLVAPTVATAEVGSSEVLVALRGAGYLPMPIGEPEPGSVATKDKRGRGKVASEPVDREPGARALEAQELRDWAREALGPGGELSELDVDDELADVLAFPGGLGSGPTAESPGDAAARLVGKLESELELFDPELVGLLRGVNRRLSDLELNLLATEILSGGAVTIRYRSSSGSVSLRTISQASFDGHAIHAWCHLRSDERMFLVESILEVRGVS